MSAFPTSEHEPPSAIRVDPNALARPVFQLTRRRDCYYCKNARPAKICGACLVARYCNAECQRLDRPAHREGCHRQVDAIKGLSPENAAKISQGGGFLDFWRSPLVRWAAHLVNFGAREPGFLIECTFMAVFGRREDPPSSAAKYAYELGSSGMIRDEHIREALQGICTTDMVDLVVARHGELPKNMFIIRFLVGTGNLWTCYAIDIRTIFEDHDFAGGNLLTALMVRSYEKDLAQAIRDGDARRDIKILQTCRRRIIEAMVERVQQLAGRQHSQLTLDAESYELYNLSESS